MSLERPLEFAPVLEDAAILMEIQSGNVLKDDRAVPSLDPACKSTTRLAGCVVVIHRLCD
jgi:D-alanyl-D-alanine carboxypeptidase